LKDDLHGNEITEIMEISNEVSKKFSLNSTSPVSSSENSSKVKKSDSIDLALYVLDHQADEQKRVTRSQTKSNALAISESK